MNAQVSESLMHYLLAVNQTLKYEIKVYSR